MYSCNREALIRGFELLISGNHSMKAAETINAVIAFGGECCCLGMQLCKTIIQKLFDDRLCDENEISQLLVKL